MFNPSSIDEVLVKTTHLEASRSKPGVEGMYKKPLRFEKQSKGEKEDGRNIATLKKDFEESTCSHY